MRKTVFLCLAFFWVTVISWSVKTAENEAPENRTEQTSTYPTVEYRQDLALKSLVLVLAGAAILRVGWVRFNNYLENQMKEE